MRGAAGHNTQPDTQLPPSFLGMDAWMTSQLNLALIRSFDMLSMDFCTARHRQLSGRLVQELNVRTVHVMTVSHLFADPSHASLDFC